MTINEIYKILKEKGYIYYGTIIPFSLLEELFEAKRTEGWDYLGSWLDLKEKIEEMGYFCTSRGCEQGDLRILEAFEMAAKAENIQKNLMRKQKKTINTMIRADISELEEINKARHSLASLKLHLGLQAMHNVLSDV